LHPACPSGLSSDCVRVTRRRCAQMRLPAHQPLSRYLAIIPVIALKNALESLRARQELDYSVSVRELQLRMKNFQDGLAIAARVKTGWKVLVRAVGNLPQDPFSCWFEALEDQFERTLHHFLRDYLTMNELLVRHLLDNEGHCSPTLLNDILNKEVAKVGSASVKSMHS